MRTVHAASASRIGTVLLQLRTHVRFDFAHPHLLSSDSFSSTLLSSNLSLLSASALLCFSSVHIVGSLTSKLPSIKTRFADGSL